MGFFSNLKSAYQEKKRSKEYFKNNPQVNNNDPNFIGSNYKGKFKQYANTAGTMVGRGAGGIRNAGARFQEMRQNYNNNRLQNLRQKTEYARQMTALEYERARVARLRQSSGGGYGGGLNALFGSPAPQRGRNNGYRQPSTLQNLDGLLNGRAPPRMQPMHKRRHKRRGSYGGGRIIILR